MYFSLTSLWEVLLFPICFNTDVELKRKFVVWLLAWKKLSNGESPTHKNPYGKGTESLFKWPGDRSNTVKTGNLSAPDRGRWGDLRNQWGLAGIVLLPLEWNLSSQKTNKSGFKFGFRHGLRFDSVFLQRETQWNTIWTKSENKSETKSENNICHVFEPKIHISQTLFEPVLDLLRYRARESP